MTVGALRPPSCPRMPLANGCPSVNACSGLWQLAQDTVPSTDSRLSKYSSQPSSAFSGVYGLSLGHWMGKRPSGTFGPSLGNGGSSPAGASRQARDTHTATATTAAAAQWKRVVMVFVLGSDQ